MSDLVSLVCASADDSAATIMGAVFKAIEASGIAVRPGMKVLVKPNLLTAVPLACTNPAVVAGVCEWLLAQGANITVADSPAFGSAEAVAKAIGLTDVLKPLGLHVRGFAKVRKLRLNLPGRQLQPKIGVAREALETDLIVSAPRVKAHSQLRVTLAVKNCYGVICGLRKAIAHARFGSSLELFCDCVAALWRQLPPVAAVCDGITAMSKTGPSKGVPFQLNLIAASPSAPAADAAILAILKLPASEIPLSQALTRAGVNASNIAYPELGPADFSSEGFEVPKVLKEISFNPLFLAKSLAKRIWMERQR